jgi:glycosyltransferase involved in cell wall biosynthesis
MRGVLVPRATRWLFRRLDLIVPTSEYVAGTWVPLVGRPKLKVLRPGVLKRMKAGPPVRERDSVVFWRNADYGNGADLMVSAVRELAPRHASIRFIFALRAGSEFQGSAQRLAEEMANVVTYVHPYPDGLTIEGILARAKFVVAPFRELTINPQMSILETLYAGVPDVASNIESNAEVVADGVTGLVLERNDAGGIVSAVERLLGDAALLETLAGNAEGVTSAAFNWYDFEAGLATVHGL